MSPLWRERIDVALSPHQVTMVRHAGGWRRRAGVRSSSACAGAGWRAALDTLGDMLAKEKVAGADATLTLSSHWVRFLVLPWNPALLKQNEEIEFARARLVQVHGESAADWELRLTGAESGATQIAAAIERPLLDGIAATCKAADLRTISIQPRLMSVWNGARGQIGKDAWVALIEPGRLLLCRVRGGRWESLRARPLRGNSVVLGEELDQERMLLGLDADEDEMFVYADPVVRVDSSGIKLKTLGDMSRQAAA